MNPNWIERGFEQTQNLKEDLDKKQELLSSLKEKGIAWSDIFMD